MTISQLDDLVRTDRLLISAIHKITEVVIAPFVLLSRRLRLLGLVEMLVYEPYKVNHHPT